MNLFTDRDECTFSHNFFAASRLYFSYQLRLSKRGGVEEKYSWWANIPTDSLEEP